MRQPNETYLGDGLYAHFDGFSYWLRAPREGGDHEVCLEPIVLQAFQEFVTRIESSRPAAGALPER